MDGSASRMFHLCYTVPILAFSLLFNITRFMELRTIEQPHNHTDVRYVSVDELDQTGEWADYELMERGNYLFDVHESIQRGS